MEETKELQTMYKIFRCLIYLSLIVEFFEYAIDPALLDYWGGIVCDIHSRVKRWFIYMDGNLVWSKIATIVLICITCIGTPARPRTAVWGCIIEGRTAITTPPKPL